MGATKDGRTMHRSLRARIWRRCGWALLPLLVCWAPVGDGARRVTNDRVAVVGMTANLDSPERQRRDRRDPIAGAPA